MYTLITLERGLLNTRLVTEDGDKEVERSRWRQAIAPAVSLLRSIGGGCLFVIHRPGDL